jgi:twitching motility protein PilJ
MAFALFRKKTVLEDVADQEPPSDTVLELDGAANGVAPSALDTQMARSFAQMDNNQNAVGQPRSSTTYNLKPLGGFKLPLIGHMSAPAQTRILGVILGVVFLIAVVIVAIDGFFSSNNSAHIEITGDTLTHTQRMAKATHTGMQGDKQALNQMQESRDRVANNLDVLENGGKYEGRTIEPTGEASAAQLAAVVKAWRTSEMASTQILSNKEVLAQLGSLIAGINAGNNDLLDMAERLAMLKLQAAAPSADLAASAQLVMLTQRLAKSANELMTGSSINPEVAFLLGKDANMFRNLLVKLEATTDPKKPQNVEILQTIKALSAAFSDTDLGVSSILSRLQKLGMIKSSEQVVFRDSELMKKELETLQESYNAERSVRKVNFTLLTIAAALVLLFALAIVKVMVDDNRARTEFAESEKELAETQGMKAKQVNDQNQAAILRLMNELQEVADGNLTVQATVSEDMTGAIADSVNYTVEELRVLVGKINSTAQGVSDATDKARGTSDMLLKLTEQQSVEIKSTGESVLDMARNITEVSNRAAASSNVAQRALVASQQGQQAVQASVHGMNTIRDQIQDTSKRIKRLGESSQQISEIVELITNITEQTNVLSLNAAIQAASAGEAGRGFTVVAEEVQRLAERSAEATKQIAALVRTIQTDTQDAVVAMERSTQGVVEGARLTDAAGAAITDVSQVSQELAQIILSIANSTRGQADQAQTVAQAMTKILSVTEQTSSGTRDTAQSTEALAVLANELKKSVARFKVVA